MTPSQCTKFVRLSAVAKAKRCSELHIAKFMQSRVSFNLTVVSFMLHMVQRSLI